MILDNELLVKATHAVIDVLSPFPPEYKIAALHTLIESFPEGYVMTQKDKE